MIEVCEPAEPAEPAVEFDEHVPVTITWPEYFHTPGIPLYVTYEGFKRYLELKFHPVSRRLIEMVLVSAGEIRRVRDSLRPLTTDETATVCWTGPTEGRKAGSYGPADMTAFDDCLVMTPAATAPSIWVGTHPVLFGLSESRQVVALSLTWNSSDREFVLTNVDIDNQ